jgi:hypothetical protein
VFNSISQHRLRQRIVNNWSEFNDTAWLNGVCTVALTAFNPGLIYYVALATPPSIRLTEASSLSRLTRGAAFGTCCDCGSTTWCYTPMHRCGVFPAIMISSIIVGAIDHVSFCCMNCCISSRVSEYSNYLENWYNFVLMKISSNKQLKTRFLQFSYMNETYFCEYISLQRMIFCNVAFNEEVKSTRGGDHDEI